ncbi:MAG: heme exporter protein CcmD [Gammaproteobacteria bacterium]|nr:heme exporter protein CcmD [Gammaproteobacteria bacterium]
MMEFLAQGGYAFYVWSCYGMGAVLLAAEIVALRKRRRTILSRLGRLKRMRDAEVNE